MKNIFSEYGKIWLAAIVLVAVFTWLGFSGHLSGSFIGATNTAQTMENQLEATEGASGVSVNLKNYINTQEATSSSIVVNTGFVAKSKYSVYSLFKINGVTGQYNGSKKRFIKLITINDESGNDVTATNYDEDTRNVYFEYGAMYRVKAHIVDENNIETTNWYVIGIKPIDVSCTNDGGHSFVSEVVNPTCLTRGYTTYTCIHCGYSYKGNSIAALGHAPVASSSPSASDLRTSATCTSKATYFKRCARCNKQINAATVDGYSYPSYYYSYGSLLAHSFTVQRELVQAATCTTQARYRFSCSRCGTYESGSRAVGSYGGHSMQNQKKRDYASLQARTSQWWGRIGRQPERIVWGSVNGYRYANYSHAYPNLTVPCIAWNGNSDRNLVVTGIANNTYFNFDWNGCTSLAEGDDWSNFTNPNSRRGSGYNFATGGTVCYWGYYLNACTRCGAQGGVSGAESYY